MHLWNGTKSLSPPAWDRTPNAVSYVARVSPWGRGTPNSNHLPTPSPQQSLEDSPKVACLLREGGGSVSAQGSPTGSVMAPKDIAS